MNYLGSKGGSGVYQAIINQMPPHHVFIDAFMGTGTVLQRKAPAPVNISLDLDCSMIECVSRKMLSTNDIKYYFYSTDAIEFLSTFNYQQFDNNVLIYCDPPYVLRTRTSNNRYKFDFTDADHVRLLTLLKRLPVKIILSGYQSRLYDDLLPNWRTIEFQAMTRGGVRTEKIWMNYQSDKLHWHDYAGQNYTDRQRIKRKVQRWQENYKNYRFMSSKQY